MTVYVDNAGIRATVHNPESGRNHTSSWCHMFSDSLDPSELHTMARSIGMRRSWFQHKPDRPQHDHYDLTANKRRQAVAAGAVEVEMEQAVEIWRAKLDEYLASQGQSTTGVSCRTVNIEVDGEQIPVSVRGPRGAEITDEDRQALADFARLLATRPIRAPRHRKGA